MVTRVARKRRRFSRRHGLGGPAARRRRNLIVAVVAVAVVVGGFIATVAVQVGPAERVYERSVNSSFAALIVPIAKETNGTGADLSSMLAGGYSNLDRANFLATLDSLVGEASTAVEQFKVLSPPRNLSKAAASCLSALKTRATALAAFRQAVAVLLASPGSTTASDPTGQTAAVTQAELSIENLGQTISTSDDTWSTCRHLLLAAPGRGRNSVPVSDWTASESLFQGTSVDSFVSSLTSTAPPAEPLKIVAVAGEPASVIKLHDAEVLPVTSTFSVHVVVLDTTTMQERNVVATASIVPLGPTGERQSVSSEATIEAGGSFSFHPAALKVTPGATYLLQVTVTGPGQGTPSTDSYRIAVSTATGVPG
jgi:hypothetical protein